MEIKQKTIGDILDSEREMFIRGEERYGQYFVNASAFNSLLNTGMIKSIDGDRFLFAMFLSQVRKHHTLGLFSAIRLHRTQAMMNLRQVLEAGACAAYAIANTEPADFADKKEDGTLDASQKLTKKRYDWLDKNFPDGARAIKAMKDAINTLGAHASVITAHSNFEANSKAGRFDTPFFDFEDEFGVRTDLWQIGNIALGLMDLFYGVNTKLGVIKFNDDWSPRFQELAKENDRLKTEMMNHDRLKRFKGS
jgi:hypothetical protein